SGRSGCSSTARGGRSSSATSILTISPRSSAAAEPSSQEPGSSSSRRDAPALELPLGAIAPARQPRLPLLRGGGVPARVAADRAALHRTAGLHVRSGARSGRGRRTTAVARPRRQDATALVGARRKRVLRHVLLCLRHALLPGQGPFGPRRPDADPARAGTLRLLARLGA